MSKLFVSRLSFLASAEQWLWYLFLGTAAWQTRILLWHEGVRFSEWTSIAIWFSDAIMMVLFALAIVRSPRCAVSKTDWLLIEFFGVAALSLAQTSAMTIGWYQLARLGQSMLFFFYLRRWAFRKFNISHSMVAFVVGALGQAVLGITQFLLRRDAGLRWAGETLLRTDMRGVAVFFDATGEKILRAYGTLPHPNVLAAYLLVAFWFWLWLWTAHHSPSVNRFRIFIWASAGFLLAWGLMATFSRTVIAAWLISFALFIGTVFFPRISGRWDAIRRVRTILRMPCAVVLFAVLAFSALFWSPVRARLSVSPQEEAVQFRIAFARDAVSTGADRLLNVAWFGVGIGNYIPWLSVRHPNLPVYALQPAHNAYLMIYAEVGFIGVVIFLAWLALLVRNGWRMRASQPVVRLGVFALIGVFLMIAANDHFTWTLQQGRILWWGVLAVVAAGSSPTKVE